MNAVSCRTLVTLLLLVTTLHFQSTKHPGGPRKTLHQCVGLALEPIADTQHHGLAAEPCRRHAVMISLYKHEAHQRPAAPLSGQKVLRPCPNSNNSRGVRDSPPEAHAGAVGYLLRLEAPPLRRPAQLASCRRAATQTSICTTLDGLVKAMVSFTRRGLELLQFVVRYKRSLH